MMQALHNYPVVPYDQSILSEKAPKPQRGLASAIYKIVDELGGATAAQINKYLPAVGYDDVDEEKVRTACRNLLYVGQLVKRGHKLSSPTLPHYKARQEWLTLNTNTAGANRSEYDRKKKKKNGNGATGPVKFRAPARSPQKTQVVPTYYANGLALAAFSGGAIVGTALGLLIGTM
jgi:hypothetical protein